MTDVAEESLLEKATRLAHPDPKPRLRPESLREKVERLLVGGPLSICEAAISSSVRGSKLPLPKKSRGRGRSRG